MSTRFAVIVVGLVVGALAVDFAAVDHAEAIVWGAGWRGYWVLFGVVISASLALAVPILARPLRRPTDYYPADEPNEGDDG